jgi:hypothetical protein
VEFIRLSAGGEDMLTELVVHLAKARTIQEAMGPETLLQHPVDVEGKTFPILRTFPPGEISEGSPLVLNPRATILDTSPEVNPVDLFI